MDYLQKIIEVRKGQLTSKELKKLKLTRSEDRYRDYTRGAIVRVNLQNFLPYEKIELFPGPYLNLIIGPNGSGKSAIVCGICLGLGGKVSTMGRATQLSDFVRRGSDKAVTEIELYNPRGTNWIICREISNSSSWKLNGVHVTKKEIDNILRDLSIQVDNLCQFLPQDRVADFGKMSQQELLLNTERAVGPETIYEYHVQLKQLRRESRTLIESIESFRERLKAEKERNQQLEVKVRHYNEREKHLENIRLLKKKRSWIEYEGARQEYVEQVKLNGTIKSDLNSLKTRGAKFIQELKENQNEMEKLEKETDKLSSSIHDYMNKINSGKKLVHECIEKTSDIEERLKNKILDHQQQEQRLETLRQQLEGLENELARSSQDEDEQLLIKQVDRECQSVAASLLKLQNTKETVKAAHSSVVREKQGIEQELQRLQDIRRRQLEVLRQKHRQTYEAVLWLQDNSDKFKKKIYEPIMTLIHVTDQKYMKYIEAHISFNDMIAFVCEDPEDINSFMSILRDSQKLKINAVLAPQEKLENFKPLKPIENFKRWGFFSYLKELFTAPNAVMTYLCHLYRIHDIPVGNEYTERCVEDVVKNTHFAKFYTSNFVFTSRRSLYGNRNVSTMSVELRTPTLLTIFKDKDKAQHLDKELQRIEQELNENKQNFIQLQEEEKCLIHKQETFRNKKRELLKKRDFKKTLNAKIKQKKESIEILQGQVIDIENEQANVSENISKLTKERLKVLNSIFENTRSCFERKVRKLHVAIQNAELFDMKLKIEQKNQETVLDIRALEDRLKDINHLLELKKKAAQYLLNVAREQSGSENASEIHSKLKIAFIKPPSTLNEIDELVFEEKAKVDCLVLTDESVVQEHLKKRQTIDELERKIKEKSHELDILDKKITDQKGVWLPQLETLIEKIDTNFSRYFGQMGCAGEVTLDKSENVEDFDNYGIAIKVKYRRNERLKELTQSYHSGGECSVATALYMIALQSLTKVPFRCVDEINQGMDAENERRVFDFLVNSACNENSSQYFLLTPKLLPRLAYTKKIKVHIIHSGTRSLKCK